MDSVKWEVLDGELKPVLPDGSTAIWAPLPGSQEAFILSPVFETLYEGPRGGGKSLLLIMSFAQYCDQGLGASWRGVLFRQTYPQLSDIIAKTKQWIPQIFPEAKYNEQRATWTWPGGEELLLRHMKDPSDYWSYHGHELPFIAFEELTTWPNDECYTRMFSCCRSSNPKVPRMVRATTNPYGVGHSWVKIRFQLPIAPGQIVGPVIHATDDSGVKLPPRVAIHSLLTENLVLMHADPGYLDRLKLSAHNEAQLKAWVEGDWDIVSGGMFEDVWRPKIHRLPSFSIPRTWRVTRAFDWGSSKPFSVGWWAESDGSQLRLPDRNLNTLKGDRFRVQEWYGWRPNKPNEGLRLTAAEVAEGIKEKERTYFADRRVYPGPADAAIFDSSTSDGESVAQVMQKHGVRWTKADKGPGSRINGWERMRTLLKNAIPPEDGSPRERPGFFVTDSCPQFIRTVPTLPRDEKNLDDVDTDAEDHCGDECRYALYQNTPRFSKRPVTGR